MTTPHQAVAGRTRAAVVGRRAELARIDALLDAARAGHTGVLSVTGQPGVGKTALLQAAAARAEAFTVSWARGIEAETTLGHAALLELLTPIRDQLDELPVAQRAALASALGWGPAAASSDRFLVAAGTLTMLAAAADRAPLLVLIDDVQWLDPESAAAILFAARRMHHDRAAFLLAARPAAARELADVPMLSVPGLSADDARRLLGDGFAPSVVDLLVSRVGGNPLALLEVGRHLTPAQRWGAAALPQHLPVGSRLDAVYEPVLAGLSADAWHALMLLAAAPDGIAAHSLAALGLAGASAALDELERHQVVARNGAALAFRHPLVRSAVWRRATPREQRDAHRALAEAAGGDPARRTWHLARAAEGTDDDLATDLVTLADHARQRQSFAEASAALEHAATLTADASTAAQVLVAAARDAFISGDTERTRALADRVLSGGADGQARGEVLHTLGVLEQYAGAVPVAADHLREAADLLRGRARTWALAELAMTEYRLNELTAMYDTAVRTAESADAAEPEQRVLADFVLGVAHLMANRAEVGRRHLRRATELLESEPSLRNDPRFLPQTILALGLLGGDGDTLPVVERRLRAARERSALGPLVPALSMTAYGRAMYGDHAGAFADAGEAAELAAHLHFVADAAPACEMLAWQYAARGLHDDARLELQRAETFVATAGTADVAAHLAVTAAFCALCRGDLEQVVALLEARLHADGGRGPTGEPLGVAPLLIEAYVALRRLAHATELAQRYATATDAPLPATAALIARCRALVSADATDALHPVGEVPRVERVSRLTDHGTGVDPPASTAQRRAVQQPSSCGLERVGGSGVFRQRGFVRLAKGLSNREVAATLFLSPKTVEHHLTSVYRKRGWRSRTELVRSYATGSTDGRPVTPPPD